MAIYPPAILKLIPPGNDPRITARVLIFHVAVSESDSLYAQFTNGSGIESHFYVRYTGVVEQYRDTAYQADANMAANDFAISVETEGLGAGTWTDAQIAALKAIALWCHAVHGIPLVQCPAWNGSGVGYHILFMQQWAGGPRACPGPDRIKQFHDVIVPWMANPLPPTLGALMALTDKQQQDLYDRVMQLPYDFGKRFLDTQGAADLTNYRMGSVASGVNTLQTQHVTLLGFNAGLLSAVQQMSKGADSVDLDAIRAAVRDEVAAAISSIDVTVHTQPPPPA